MPSDPFFDDFKKIRKLFEKAMNGGNFDFDATTQGITIKKVGNRTQIEVQGDVSEERIEKLRRKYPNAEINVNNQRVKSEGPVDVIDEDEEMDSEEEEERFSSQELALKRFQEKKENDEDHKDS